MNNYELAEKDYKAGMKYKDIATKYNVTINTVKSWKTRYGWQREESTQKKTDVCTQDKKGMHTKESMQLIEKSISEEKEFEYIDDDGLTDRQRLFCYYYMQSFNAYQAAIKAGYSESYSRVKVYELLEKVSVKDFLKRLKEQQRTEFMLSQEKVLNRHLQIAFSDITEYINPDGTLKHDIDGTLIKKMTIKTSKVELDSGYKENNTVSLEMEDRKESLKFLTKYVGLDIEDEGKDKESSITNIRKKYGL